MNTPKDRTKYYAVADIARLTGIVPHDILKKAEELGTPLTSHDNAVFIERALLPEFFDAFFEGQHYRTRYRLPSWLASSEEPWCRVVRAVYEESVSRPTSLSPQQGEFLRSLVVNANPRHVVEIGSFIGVSTLWIAGALKDARNSGRMTAIDLFADIFPMANKSRTRCILDPIVMVKKNLKEAGVDSLVRLMPGNSQEIGAKWGTLGQEPIDFLYIDGDHTAEGCMADFQNFLPHVRPGGLIVLHDVFPEICGCKGPRHLLNFLRGHRQFETFDIETSPHNFGMSLVRLRTGWKPRKEVID